MLRHDEIYALEKRIWTEADFDQMGWHDARVHALAFDIEKFKLFLDIDYIYAWVAPAPTRESFSFWVSPCTLVFRDVGDLQIDLSSTQGVEIADLHREVIEPKPGATLDKLWRWTLECQEGDVSFEASGFTQYTRRPPAHMGSQHFSFSERGGFSFDVEYAVT